MVQAPSFTIGIEEEYFLVNRETRALESEPPRAMLKACANKLKNRVKAEFLKTQIEVATPVCKSIKEARESLGKLRRTVIEVADVYGLAPIAASTHPFSEWQEQKHTRRQRYENIARDLQGVVRRLLVGGMHVHVGIDDDQLRIDLLNQVSYFLPHLLALSTSSPFWRGENTGLKSYRRSIFHEIPRSGMPERFESYTEYQRHVDVLTRAGLIKDASMLWWDVRPSARFPTLEMRITDVCPRLDDAVAIAALYLCILRMLYRLRRNNQRWRLYAPMLVKENLWRAQRYGLDEGLMDFGAGELVGMPDLLEELIDLTAPDAKALNCAKEVRYCRSIIKRGTGADLQLDTYASARAKGAEHKEALVRVVDRLIKETAKGLR